jgi:hypothetical protein
MMMRDQDASNRIVESVTIYREDISRAKAFALREKEWKVVDLADRWLHAQNYTEPEEIYLESTEIAETLAVIAKSYSLRMALYQAVWELINAGEFLLAGNPAMWKASMTWRTSHGGGGLDLHQIYCTYPTLIQKPPFTNELTPDVDIFFKGLDCINLHEGIREAIEQSLKCFRRGLYLPAIAMLTACAEAAWHECGTAVAANLGNRKLQALMDDHYASLSKKVSGLNKILASPTGKQLLKAANLSPSRLADAELWTTTLRDRRNALHWMKAKSFVTQHSDTASLLLGTPIHLGTLEAIRNAC